MRRESKDESDLPWQMQAAHAKGEQVKALRHAIETGEIRPYYQPIVDLRSRRIIGFEALARWISPRGLQVGPAEFIPLAASAGLLNLLTQSLLQKACREAARWPSQLTLAINVAPSQFPDDTLPLMIERVAHAEGFSLSRLVVEITEDVLRGSPEKATAITNELRSLGVRLAMDDFGIGDSNIRRLGLVEFGIIKIDRSVINGMTPEIRTHRGLIAAIAVGTSLGLQVIAEGVEEEWQAAVLRSLGCPTIQGWLTGRPMPATDIPALLAGTDQLRRPVHHSTSPNQPRASQSAANASIQHALMAKSR